MEPLIYSRDIYMIWFEAIFTGNEFLFLGAILIMQWSAHAENAALHHACCECNALEPLLAITGAQGLLSIIAPSNWKF